MVIKIKKQIYKIMHKQAPMSPTNKMKMWKVAIVCLTSIAALPEFCAGLRNVNVRIPSAVKRGENALLICNYDIENDTLYTVKWYRGRREFYRYTPKENPAWKIFTKSNEIDVEATQSNASHVLLRNVPTSISGKFACEVSADAPTFDTSIVAADMEVVELPTQRPIITGIHSRYRLGDNINGNCSSDYSKPAANLTWWINDIQVPPNYLRIFDIQRHVAEHLESAVLELNFIVTVHHFIKGRLKLKCSARIHDIYAQESEKLLEEDRPRILASGRSPDMNMYPFDQPGDADEHNELFLTHKNAASSAAGTLLILNLAAIQMLQQLILLLLFFIWPAACWIASQHQQRQQTGPEQVELCYKEMQQPRYREAQRHCCCHDVAVSQLSAAQR